MNPIKNQGNCGSCWAFSAISSVEAAYAVQKDVKVVLSEQAVIDCDKIDQGCNGGS